MVKVGIRGEIMRPVQEVFDYLTDPEKELEWNSLAVEVKAEEPGPIRVGSRIHSVSKFLGRRLDHTNEITELVPNRRYTSKSTSPFSIEATFTFEPTARGTNLDISATAEPGGFYKLAEPVIGRIAQKQFQVQFNTVKRLLETRAARPN